LSFLTPGDSAGLMVDSEEEIFTEANHHFAAENQESGSVKFIFPLLTGDVGLDEEWQWNVCGGLIGGDIEVGRCRQNSELRKL
jgi:hypothetical protein